MKITKRQLRRIIKETLEASFSECRLSEVNLPPLSDEAASKNIDKIVTAQLKDIALGKSRQPGANDSAARAGAEAAYTLIGKGRLSSEKFLKAFGVENPLGVEINVGKLSQLNYNDRKKFKKLPLGWQKVLDPTGQGEFTGRDFIGVGVSGTF